MKKTLYIVLFLLTLIIGCSNTDSNNLALEDTETIRNCNCNDSLVDVDVFWLGGQSNAIGKGEVSNLPPNLQNPENFLKILDFNQEKFVDYVAGAAIQYSVAGNWFGAEISLAYEHFQATGKPLYLVKIGRDGAPINNDLGRLDWSEESDELRGIAKEMWRMAVKDLYSQGLCPNVIGAFWMQGEQDSKITYYPTGYNDNPYYFKLENMYQFVRQMICECEQNFVIGKVLEQQTYGTEVRQDQEQFSIDNEYVEFIETSSYPLTDPSHYDHDGLIQMGIDVWNKL